MHILLVEDDLDLGRALQAAMADDPGVRQLGRQVAAGLREVDDDQQTARMVAGLAGHANAGRHRVAMLPGELQQKLELGLRYQF